MIGIEKFNGSETVEVNGIKLTADQIFINVGARPSIPDSFKGVDYLTSNNKLELETFPEHLTIIGGSYIGLELGQMFRRFGNKVTLVEKEDQLLSKEATVQEFGQIKFETKIDSHEVYIFYARIYFDDGNQWVCPGQKGI